MPFVTYRKYFEEEQANALVDILKDTGISYEVAVDRESLDALYGDKPFSKQFSIKIQQRDFSLADNLLLKLSAQGLNSVEADHYLFNFNDEELIEILAKPDEWNEFDYQLAQKILAARGKIYDSQSLTDLKEKRIIELGKPEKKNRGWIYAGYVFALLGGLLGIFIGWHLSTHKKTLPDGQRVFGFDAADRMHGWRIIFIGIAMLVILGVLQFLQIA